MRFLVAVFVSFLSVYNSQSLLASDGFILGPQDSNCGDVKNILEGIPKIQQSKNIKEVIQNLSLFDMKNFKRFCTEGDCRYEKDPLKMASHMFMESKIIQGWEPTNVSESYGRKWAKANFTLQITNVCGESSEPFEAEFVFYCNGEKNKVTQVHALREAKEIEDFMAMTKECVKDKIPFLRFLF